MRKIAGYIILVASILIMYTRLARLLFDVYFVDCLLFASKYWRIWRYEDADFNSMQFIKEEIT